MLRGRDALVVAARPLRPVDHPYFDHVCELVASLEDVELSALQDNEQALHAAFATAPSTPRASPRAASAPRTSTSTATPRRRSSSPRGRPIAATRSNATATRAGKRCGPSARAGIPSARPSTGGRTSGRSARRRSRREQDQDVAREAADHVVGDRDQREHPGDHRDPEREARMIPHWTCQERCGPGSGASSEGLQSRPGSLTKPTNMALIEGTSRLDAREQTLSSSNQKLAHSLAIA